MALPEVPSASRVGLRVTSSRHGERLRVSVAREAGLGENERVRAEAQRRREEVEELEALEQQFRRIGLEDGCQLPSIPPLQRRTPLPCGLVREGARWRRQRTQLHALRKQVQSAERQRRDRALSPRPPSATGGFDSPVARHRPRVSVLLPVGAAPPTVRKELLLSGMTDSGGHDGAGDAEDRRGAERALLRGLQARVLQLDLAAATQLDAARQQRRMQERELIKAARAHRHQVRLWRLATDCATAEDAQRRPLLGAERAGRLGLRLAQLVEEEAARRTVFYSVFDEEAVDLRQRLERGPSPDGPYGDLLRRVKGCGVDDDTVARRVVQEAISCAESFGLASPARVRSLPETPAAGAAAAASSEAGSGGAERAGAADAEAADDAETEAVGDSMQGSDAEDAAASSTAGEIPSPTLPGFSYSEGGDAPAPAPGAPFLALEVALGANEEHLPWLALVAGHTRGAHLPLLTFPEQHPRSSTCGRLSSLSGCSAPPPPVPAPQKRTLLHGRLTPAVMRPLTDHEFNERWRLEIDERISRDNVVAQSRSERSAGTPPKPLGHSGPRHVTRSGNWSTCSSNPGSSNSSHFISSPQSR
eukprot:TRINITY_DN17508_c0_g1_i1.p1 TRINITY_DN17508_c0_g1~~TRINITY_DN17508_c0_g1_i1.p1  ORF type:complete len:590 (+),score=164.46 TRINITY_DN17508_c0_g1_i1:102-1871(+)